MLCRERGDTLTGLLAKAGVSRNAFYSLARRKSVFPRSLNAVSARLGVGPGELLTGDDRRTEQMKVLMSEAEAIARRKRGVDRDNVRHALLLLRKTPIERLRMALGRSKDRLYLRVLADTEKALEGRRRRAKRTAGAQYHRKGT
jgi:hypothetical protein